MIKTISYLSGDFPQKYFRQLYYFCIYLVS